MQFTEHVAPGRHDFWSADREVHVAYTQFSQNRDGSLKAYLEVHANGEPNPGIVDHRWFRLGSDDASTARDLAKLNIAGWSETDWKRFLSITSAKAKNRHEEGDPFETIGGTFEPVRFLVRPYVRETGATILAAEGGSNKSFFALALALTCTTGRAGFLGVKPFRTGPVLYLDWEDDREAHTERAWALCNPLGIDPESGHRIIYQKMRTNLASGIDALLTKLAKLPPEQRPILAVIDSAGKAIGGSVNDDEATNRLFAAIDRLDMPTFIIDHKSKEAIKSKAKGAIGSVYKWNSARMLWDLEKVQSIGTDRLTLKLTNSKSNGTRLQPSTAFEVEFVNEGEGNFERLTSVSYRPIDPYRVVAMSFEGATTAEAILGLLAQSDEGMTTEELADLTEKSEATIRKTLSRMTDDVRNVSSGGRARWLLVDRDDRVELPANIA